MEQKPLRRHIEIQRLSKDHHSSLLFCWKIRQGLKLNVDPERIKKYVASFWQHHMQPHFREEEEILFAPVKDERVEKALEDHREIREQVHSVLQSGGPEAAGYLSGLADLVDAHVRYEERELFPHLEKTLTAEQLTDIGRQLKDEPVLKDDYEDQFWVKDRSS